MNHILPLPVAIPLAVAAFLTAASSVISRRTADWVAITTGAVSVLLCLLVLVRLEEIPVAYWFGGWQPTNGIAFGIAFTVDRFGLVTAANVALLGTASLIFSYHYFDSVGTLFHTLMLVFIGSMVGFCLSGDLFTFFVFFELMGATAFGLTGYKVEESSLSGAINFAVTNSIGAFLMFLGIGLVYGRTGALNMAQIGRSLAMASPDSLLLASFVLIMSGLFIKGSIVPFHFWLSDAHAVAPTPVCVLFSGVMVGLGLFGGARVYWAIFSESLHSQEQALRTVLLFGGIFTALLGGVMCFLQRHLKRLLAFSSISHMGIILVAFSLFDPVGLAGGVIYFLIHGLIKGGLFLCVGILLHRLESVDEFDLRGKGRAVPLSGVVFALGGLLLAGMPPFGLSIGKGLIESAAEKAGYGWTKIAFFFASALTGGAVLRAAGRIFLGLGREKGEEKTGATEQEKPETKGSHGLMLWVTFGPAAALIVLSVLLSASPDLSRHGVKAAAEFQNWRGYGEAVLYGKDQAFRNVQVPPVAKFSPVSGALSTLGAVLFAILSLFLFKLSKKAFKFMDRSTDLPVRALQAVHSGHVAEYIAWIAFGVGAFGVCLAILLQ